MSREGSVIRAVPADVIVREEDGVEMRAVTDWAQIGLAFTVLSVTLACPALMTSGAAQEHDKISSEEYIWRTDKNTGKDIAASRNDLPSNFMVVGNLSSYSFYLVDHWTHLLANATGSRIDRTLKSFSLVVVHDGNVFTRLKNDRHSFDVFGIPPFMIDDMQKRAGDGVSCISSSFEGGDTHDILVTVILVAEKYNGCLVQGLFSSFGVRTGIHEDDFNMGSLLNACILYEGRRSGMREREELRKERSALAQRCLKSWGAKNDG